jgi:hypothetical protein
MRLQIIADSEAGKRVTNIGCEKKKAIIQPNLDSFSRNR